MVAKKVSVSKERCPTGLRGQAAWPGQPCCPCSILGCRRVTCVICVVGSLSRTGVRPYETIKPQGELSIPVPRRTPETAGRDILQRGSGEVYSRSFLEGCGMWDAGCGGT